MMVVGLVNVQNSKVLLYDFAVGPVIRSSVAPTIRSVIGKIIHMLAVFWYWIRTMMKKAACRYRYTLYVCILLFIKTLQHKY